MWICFPLWETFLILGILKVTGWCFRQQHPHVVRRSKFLYPSVLPSSREKAKMNGISFKHAIKSIPLSLCLSSQYSLPVLPCCRGAALPLRMAAHLHPRAAHGYARHRLHSDPVHRRPAVQYPASAHWAAPGGGQRAPNSSIEKNEIRLIAYKNGNGKMLFIIIITVFHVQVLVVDLGNNRFLRQVGHVLSHVCVIFFFVALHNPIVEHYKPEMSSFLKVPYYTFAIIHLFLVYVLTLSISAAPLFTLCLNATS